MMKSHSAPRIRALIAGLAVFCTAATSHSDNPPTLQWIQQFGPNISIRAVASDTLGNVFLSGPVAHGGFLRNYNLSGNLQWSHDVTPATEKFIATNVWPDGHGLATQFTHW